jgi:hypothetical protein
VPADEPEEAARRRAEKRAWLAEHDYTVVTARMQEVERDLKATLDTLAAAIAAV